MIHPTAIISPKATLASDVEVGPYCVIGDDVVLGEGCVLRNHVSLEGPSTFGPRNLFYPHCSIGARTQDLKYAGEPTSLIVGAENTFRECVTVNRGTAAGAATRIGSHNLFLAYSHVAHDCTVGDHVIFSNNGTIAGHVMVEDHAIISGLSAVHQFCRVGRHSITGGCSKIVLDVPPFMIVDGNPGAVRGVNQVGLQRAGHSEEDVRALREAYKALFLKKVNMTTALEKLEASPCGENALVQYLVAFIRGSERGVTR